MDECEDRPIKYFYVRGHSLNTGSASEFKISEVDVSVQSIIPFPADESISSFRGFQFRYQANPVEHDFVIFPVACCFMVVEFIRLSTFHYSIIYSTCFESFFKPFGIFQH